MFHFNPKISIEVCPYHCQATPLYGDGFTVSRSDGSAYGIILICNSMHF
jgi:hypothetical protein